MAWLVMPREIADSDGAATGRFRLAAYSDEGGGGPWGDDSHDHATAKEAMDCDACRTYCDRVTGFPTPKPSARASIAKMTATPPAVDPLDAPLAPLVEEAIARYGKGSEPPITPEGWMSWGEEERAQWGAYVRARWV